MIKIMTTVLTKVRKNTGWGFGDIIAVGEIMSALLFFITKTNIFGAFLLSSHMGRAIATQMSNDEPFIVQSVKRA